jgi:hypothetical protein
MIMSKVFYLHADRRLQRGAGSAGRVGRGRDLGYRDALLPRDPAFAPFAGAPATPERGDVAGEVSEAAPRPGSAPLTQHEIDEGVFIAVLPFDNGVTLCTKAGSRCWLQRTWAWRCRCPDSVCTGNSGGSPKPVSPRSTPCGPPR